MTAAKRESVRDIDFIAPPEMVDEELRLVLLETVPADHQGGFLPVYKFRMQHVIGAAALGEINLRVGYTDNVMFYRGNIGFTVYEAYRGNAYAERGCRLLTPLIRHHGLYPVWLTCNADNTASRKTIGLSIQTPLRPLGSERPP